MTCTAATCDRPVAALEFDLPLDVRTARPLLEVLCIGHARRSACCRCGAPGLLYPAGPYCPAHLPQGTWRRAQSLPAADTAAVSAPAGPPLLTAVDCPVDRLPRGVARSMVLAAEHGWTTGAGYAIGPDPQAVRSVVMRCGHPDGRRLATRHEQSGDGGMRFAAGWSGSVSVRRIGWREVAPILAGTYAADDRAALLAAMDVCVAADMEVLRVEVRR